MKKKLNNKGFAFAELLTVTVVVLGIFMVVYSNLFPIMGELEVRQQYNDISSTYAAYYVRRLILDSLKEDSTQTLNEIINNENYKVIYEDTDDTFKIYSIASKLGIKKVYLSTYNISALKKDMADSNQYIDYLPNYNNYKKNQVNSKEKEFYRIIVETDTGYATMPIYSTTILECEQVTDFPDNIKNLILKELEKPNGVLCEKDLKKEITIAYTYSDNIDLSKVTEDLSNITINLSNNEKIINIKLKVGQKINISKPDIVLPTDTIDNINCSSSGEDILTIIATEKTYTPIEIKNSLENTIVKLEIVAAKEVSE